MKYMTPILLAGGTGKRLWPLSRKNYPKQFTKITQGETLFQQSALRFMSSKHIHFKNQITVTNSSFRFIVHEQLINIGKDPGLILIEPEAKNTAAAIIAATIFEFKNNSDAIMIATPSDHIISDKIYFNEIITSCLEAVDNGNIVTFGITPTHPETGYGYLKLELTDKLGPKRVLSFVEKPNKKSAYKMFSQNNYFWNSGIFLFRAKDLINAYNLHAKDILTSVEKAINKSVKDLDFVRLDPNNWSNIKEISIDYAIMEKANNLVGIPYNSSWTDLGNWDSVWSETKQGENNISLSKNAHAIDCKNILLRSENSGQEIVGLGLKNIVAIAMPDAVLVANKQKSQDVKKIVDYLKIQNIRQSEEFPKEHRPWGWFENLCMGQGFKVKRIFVKQGASLSLQKHKYRSEHWVIAQGEAKITIDKDVKMGKEGQSFFVPKGKIHRLENPGNNPLIIIEIQIGSYFGEDDIIRLEDIYSRKANM
tara:strand:+ start:3912 stop:5348 length:1437 start_codon:yes stop_codon:yes gene_type:complete